MVAEPVKRSGSSSPARSAKRAMSSSAVDPTAAASGQGTPQVLYPPGMQLGTGTPTAGASSPQMTPDQMFQALTQRLSALEQDVHQKTTRIDGLTAELGNAHQKYMKLTADFNGLQAQMGQRTAQATGMRKHVSSTGNYKTLEKFTGEDASMYDHWAFRAKEVLFAVDPDFREVLQWLADQPEESAPGSIDAKRKDFTTLALDEMDADIWALLCGKVAGKAFQTVMSSEHVRWKGLITWQRLYQEATGDRDARTEQLSKHVQSPARVNYAQLQAALHKWDKDVAELRLLTGHAVADYTQITALKRMIPEDMRLNLDSQNGVNTLAEVRRYIKDQLRKKQTTEEVKPKKVDATPKPKANPNAMDVDALTLDQCKALLCKLLQGESEDTAEVPGEHADACHQAEEAEEEFVEDPFDRLLAAMKGGHRPKGKGKGKGFQGNCYNCGIKGHSWRECRKPQKDDRQWPKGGGQEYSKGYQKGGYGKSSSFNPPQGQPKGYGWQGKGPSWQGKGVHGFEEGPPANGWMLAHVSRAQTPEAEFPKLQDTIGVPSRRISGQSSFAHKIPFSVIATEDEEDVGAVAPSKIAQSQPLLTATAACPRKLRKRDVKISLDEFLCPNVVADLTDDARRPEAQSRLDPGKQLEADLQTVKPEATAQKEPLAYLGVPAESGGVNNLQQEIGGWTKWSTVVDSGSADNVAPPSAAKRIAVSPSLGSQNGQVYYSADGGVIPNLGEKIVPMQTEEGDCLQARYQIAAVTKPLTSVSKICDQGHQVIFQADGGWVLNLRSGQSTWFPREQGVYMLHTWVWAGAEQEPGFTRPGR